MDFAFPRQAHAFVDESKAKGYYIAAAVISPSDVAAARSTISGLRHKGSGSVHFKSEKDSMRQSFLKGVVPTGAQTFIYVVKDKPDKIARPACLRALVDDLCAAEASRLILDQDDSLAAADRKIIAAQLRSNQSAGIEYGHRKRQEEPLLWVSDAVAWCYQKGGPWIDYAAPLVAGVRRL
jgi:hypothetical protein